MMQDTVLLCAGISHKTAPVEVRERLTFTASELPHVLAHMRQEFQGSALLSTCNRVEMYFSGSSQQINVAAALSFLDCCKGLKDAADPSHFYVFTNEDAARHLFRVASGLDSMVIGENQILGQVRAALVAANEAGCLDGVLSRLFHMAIAVGRRARHETQIGRHAISVSSAAVALARKLSGDLSSRTILVISAGEAGKLAARAIRDSGAGRILVTSRTYRRAAELAEGLGGEAVRWSGLEQALAQADIVISSTGADTFVVEPEVVNAAMQSRALRPLLMIDIAVPRDVHPDVGSIPGVRLFNIDDLQELVNKGSTAKSKEIAKVEAIVEEAMVEFRSWWDSREILPAIAALHRWADNIRQGELEKTLSRLSLSPEERERVEAMSQAIINKILHHPITRLRSAEANGHYLQALRELFPIDTGYWQAG